MDIAKEFGQRVRTLRVGLGLTLEELAMMASISKTGLWEIEQGQSIPGIDTAMKIAHALKTPIGSLMNGSTHEPTQERIKIVSALLEQIRRILAR